ncbi:hypothetical protein [Paraburkholderia sp. C35]|uniref:hypothetical protein n=1 Tax=Paraburkholderia sp. C35 TaxID=2126993 RepID=UPI000D697314|nr:hypothetical protein [Paraburkholderia sp. C35]
MKRLMSFPQCEPEQIEAGHRDPIPESIIVNGRSVRNRFRRGERKAGYNVIAIDVKITRRYAFVKLTREAYEPIEPDAGSDEWHMSFTENTTYYALSPEELASVEVEIETAESHGAQVSRRADLAETVTLSATFDYAGYAARTL